MMNLVIAGSGGFSHEILWLIERADRVERKWNFLRFIDNDLSAECVLGDDGFLMGCEKEMHVVIAIGSPEVRCRLSRMYMKNPFLKFPNVIDSSVAMSDSVKMGQGNIICAGSILTVGVTLGDFDILNLACTVGHVSTIRDCATINPGVNISGDVLIESFADVGTGAQIIQGRTIGRGTRVGAGATVVRDLPGRCVAVGTPARPIRYFGGKDERDIYYSGGGSES